jgi:ubiquinone/menaquinone biosynthesis C-methylase UbiE
MSHNDSIERYADVNAAFSKQSHHFDEEDFANPILLQWRQLIYQHVDSFLYRPSTILELNAGTGIDAVRFVRQGHSVHATDLSDGMIEQLKMKSRSPEFHNRLTVQQVSFEKLNEVGGKYDFVFSNFGGLNCLDDLTKVTHHLPRLLMPDGYVTWVIMPPVCFWEWAWALQGNFKKGFRRLNKKATAHLEGEIFTAYYYSLNDLITAFKPSFKLVKVEALGFISPPPASFRFVKRNPRITAMLNWIETLVRKRFPFNRSGDHLIVTFKFVDEQ